MIALADLKALLGVTTAADDALLTLLEAAAAGFVARYTGRYFGAEKSVVEYPIGINGMLYLSEIPKANTLALETMSGTTGTAVAAAEYLLEGRTLHHVYGVWSPSPRAYRATYTAGYLVNAEPSEIRAAVLDLVATRYRQKGREGLQSESIGGYGYTLADVSKSDQSVFLTLDLWRRVPV